MTTKNKDFNIHKTIELGDKLLDLSTPVVMGILNLTDDSFYDGGRYNSEKNALKQTEKLLDEGASIIDIGAYSSRPNAPHVSFEQEWNRLKHILKNINREFPDAILSVDTFRSEIVRRVLELGADVINDISAGEMDNSMLTTIGKLNVPYIMMHMKGTPQTMQTNPSYTNLLAEIQDYFKSKISFLKEKGASRIIIDPGFGFGKTIEDNYKLLNQMDSLQSFRLPIMVGLSRKSMIYKLLKTNPDKALNGTTVLHTISLLKGASIIRAHDVREAVECIKLVNFAKTTT